MASDTHYRCHQWRGPLVAPPCKERLLDHGVRTPPSFRDHRNLRYRGCDHMPERPQRFTLTSHADHFASISTAPSVCLEPDRHLDDRPQSCRDHHLSGHIDRCTQRDHPQVPTPQRHCLIQHEQPATHCPVASSGETASAPNSALCYTVALCTPSMQYHMPRPFTVRIGYWWPSPLA